MYEDRIQTRLPVQTHAEFVTAFTSAWRILANNTGREKSTMGTLIYEEVNYNEGEDPFEPALNIYIYIYIYSVPGGMCQTSGGCSLC